MSELFTPFESGNVEKPKPGTEGITTSKESFEFIPKRVGSVRIGITFCSE